MIDSFINAAVTIERNAGLACGQCGLLHWMSDTTAFSERCGCCPACSRSVGRWLYRVLPEDLRPSDGHITRPIMEEALRRLQAETDELEAQKVEWERRHGVESAARHGASR